MPQFDEPHASSKGEEYRAKINEAVEKIFAQPTVALPSYHAENSSSEDDDDTNPDDKDDDTSSENKGPQEHPYTDDDKRDISHEDSIAGLNPQVKQYVNIVKQIAQHYPNNRITIGSGYRTPKDQANIMRDNWNSKGGKNPLKKPVLYSYNGKQYRAETEGTKYLMGLYGDKDMAYKMGHALETDGVIDGISWRQWIAAYWQKGIDKGDKGHMTGDSVDLSRRTAPDIYAIVEESKKYADIHAIHEGNHCHVDVHSIKAQADKSKEPVAFYVPKLTKQALNISVEPYESVVAKAMEQIASKNPNYFNYTDQSGQPVNVQHVVLEAGDPGHFGKVQSDKPDTIFLSLDKIKSAIGGQTDPAHVMNSIIEVLAHEMGHLKANFQGGEGPAEAEANRVKTQFPVTASERLASLVRASSYQFMKDGLLSEAYIAQQLIDDKHFMRLGYIAEPTAQDVAQSIVRIVYHFAQKVKPESRQNYVTNIRNRISQLNTMELSNKKKNPGAGVGASLSIAKNLLGGFPADFVQMAIAEAVQALQGII